MKQIRVFNILPTLDIANWNETADKGHTAGI